LNTQPRPQIRIGPVSFDWHDLAFEVLASDSVIVIGEFDRGTPDGIERYSCSDGLQRQEGELRIRLEAESRLRDARGAPP
jgi:hypothetical protein